MINAIYVLWLAGALLTMLWLDKRVDRSGLILPARFGLTVMVWLSSLLFPLTWLAVGIGRVKRRWRA